MTAKHFLLLLNGYFDDTLSEDDKVAFKRELAASDDSRRLFWEYAYQHAFTREFLLEKEGRAGVHLLKTHRGGQARVRKLLPALAVAAALTIGLGLFLLRTDGPARATADWIVLTRHIGQVQADGHTYRTGPDSFARLDLADGSVVALDQNSVVSFARDADGDVIVATHGAGQIYLDVAAGADAFSILSGASDIRIAGTRLMVRKDAYLAVLAGRVHADRFGRSAELTQGDLAVFGTDELALRLVRAPFRADAFSWLAPLGLEPDAMLADANADAPPNDLLALYVFDQGEGTVIRDVSGVGEPMDLTILKPENTEWLDDALHIKDSADIRYLGDATKLKEAWRNQNGITFCTWVRSSTVQEDSSKDRRFIKLRVVDRATLWWTFSTRRQRRTNEPLVNPSAFLDEQNLLTMLVPFMNAKSEKEIGVSRLDQPLALHKYRNPVSLTISPAEKHFDSEKDVAWRGELIAFAIYSRPFTHRELKDTYLTGAPPPRSPGVLPVQGSWAFEKP